jgi:uncharacterized protein involved in outer membrane biogenesis
MKILYGFLAFVVLVVVAALVAPLLVDWDRYKPDVTERVEALTGRKLWIDGDVQVALLPSPRLSIADVRLANVPGAAASDMARLKALNLNLALGPLLSGEIQITSLKLIDPVIELERLADGRVNWEFEPREAEVVETVLAKPGGEPSAGGETDAREVRLDSLSIRNGTIILRDTGSGRIEHLQRLDASLSAKTLDGPFRADGRMELRDLPLSFRVATGSVSEASPTSLSFEVDLDDGLAAAKFDGAVRDVRTAPKVSGSVRIDGNNLAAALAVFEVEAASSNGAILGQPFVFKGALSGAKSGFYVSDLQIRLGEMQVGGEITVGLGETPQLDTKLVLNRVDLDDLLAATGAVEGGTVTGDGAAPSGADSAPVEPAAADEEEPIAALLAGLPDDVSASVDLTAETLRYRKGIVRRAQVIVSLDDGIITIQQASALLPGGADMAVFGQLAPGDDGIAFDGQVEMAADDLRSVLAWLEVDVAIVPPDRLRRFSLVGEVTADDSRVRIANLDARLDSSRITGSASLDHGARPMIGADLKIDRLNADAYLGKSAPEPAGAADGDEPVAGETGETGEVGEADEGEGGAPVPKFLESEALAVFETFDATLRLAADSVTLGEVRFENLALDGDLRQGTLTLRRFDVADAAGVRLALRGDAGNFTAKPTINLGFEGEAKSLFGLLRVSGLGSAFRAEDLGQVSLKGSVNGDVDSMTLSADLKTARADLSVLGNVAALLGQPRLNLGLRLDAPDTAALLRVADLAPSTTVRRLGPLMVDGGVDGTFDALTLNFGAQVGGSTLQLAGEIYNLTEHLGYDLSVDLANPKFGELAELLTGTSSERTDVGAVRIKGRLRGDAVEAKISEFDLSIGETSVGGVLTLRVDQPTPYIKADLEAGLLNADLFMGGATAAAETRSDQPGGGEGAATGGGEASRSGAAAPVGRWSTKPIDLAVLRAVDGEFALKADALIAGGNRFEEAVLGLTLQDGTLNIHTLRGRIFDGQIEAEGRVVEAGVATAILAFNLTDVDLAAALRQAADVEAVTGRASIDGRFATEGRSEYDLISALSGDARLNARDGSVQGVDLPAVSAKLDDLNSTEDFLVLAQTGLSGGTTRLDSLDGTITVQNGLARTDDLRILADRGEGTVRGTADLPGWRLDLRALFRLTEHAEAPPIGVRLSGPIDTPRREFLLEEMQAYMAERLAKSVARKVIVPKLREGAKAEPGTVTDAVLRGLFGDPDAPQADGAAPPAEPPPEASAPQAAPPPAQQERPLEPEDVLRDLLEKVIN